MLDRGDIERLKDATGGGRLGIRNRAALETMHRAGLRVSEVCDLAPSDVRWTARELSVRHGKGDRDRVVPVDDVLLLWLSEWESIRPNAPTFFCSLKGTRTAPRYWQALLKPLARKIGMDPALVTPHVFRHSFATEALDDGFTLREVQELLGHASVNNTQVYLHVRPADLAAKIRARTRTPEAPAPSPNPMAGFVATLNEQQREALAAALQGTQSEARA